MNDYQTLTLTIDEGVATLALNRPDNLNSINNEMRRELLAALDTISNDPDIRVLVLTGTGRAFCAGGDVKGMGKKERLINPKHIVLKLAGLEIPVISAVNGVAAGAGCALGISGDITIAAAKAKFVFSHTRIGLVPDWGFTYFLQKRVSTSTAKELIFTAGRLGADEALKAGLVDKVFEEDQFEEGVKALALKFAKAAPMAVKLAKKNIEMAAGRELSQVLDMERMAIDICRISADHKEGLLAFKEKRDPVFTGA